MAGAPGIDFPEERAVVDLVTADPGRSLIAWVELTGDDELVVSVGADRAPDDVQLEPGEHLDVVWRGPAELRSLPVELVAAGRGPGGVSRLRPLGPAVRGQRRSSVRAPVGAQVRVTWGATTATGATLDLSEGGIRAVFTAPLPGAAPGPTDGDRPPGRLGRGQVVALVLCLDEVELPCRAEVTRRITRSDGLTELSCRFVGLSERGQDQIRRRVFTELRDLRARGLL